MLIPNSIHVWRVNDEYHLEWQTSEPGAEVSVEPMVVRNGTASSLIREAPNKMRVLGLPPGQRHFFQLRDQHGTRAVVSERRLEMQGSRNFRDFGGYHTSEGRMVKWGHLFRSGHLAELGDADLALLSNLRLHFICDFRDASDRRLNPSRVPESLAAKIRSLPIVPGGHSNFIEELKNNPGGRRAMEDVMIQINLDFVESHGEAYGNMFAEILKVQDARFLIHCAAGKDRTGFAAALILLALGVPKNVVMRDYMLSGRYFDPHPEFIRMQKNYDTQLDFEQFKPLLGVDERYLAAALTAIETRYKSVEGYLDEVLGVDRSAVAELRGRYLE